MKFWTAGNLWSVDQLPVHFHQPFEVLDGLDLNEMVHHERIVFRTLSAFRCYYYISAWLGINKLHYKNRNNCIINAKHEFWSRSCFEAITSTQAIRPDDLKKKQTWFLQFNFQFLSNFFFDFQLFVRKIYIVSKYSRDHYWRQKPSY